MILELQQLTMDFGGLRAVDAVNLNVQQGEIVSLIGPNGAGKTTVFNCATGMYTPSQGKIIIFPPHAKKGENIAGNIPNRITKKGLARTFQNIRLFLEMTALENVMLGCHVRLKSNLWQSIFRTEGVLVEEKQTLQKSYECMKFVGIEKYANEVSKNLSYGIQRKLEIARALATDPFLLLLDEPAAGMNPRETDDLCDLIVALRERVSIFLIEHDMNLVMKLADRIYVMDYGKLIAMGKPHEIKSNPEVIRAYLGDGDA